MLHNLYHASTLSFGHLQVNNLLQTITGIKTITCNAQLQFRLHELEWLLVSVLNKQKL